jgi:hypothetical protein
LLAVAGPTPARSSIDSIFFFASVTSLAVSSVASLVRFLGSITTPQYCDISTQSNWYADGASISILKLSFV